jgi:hypothetical protein
MGNCNRAREWIVSPERFTRRLSRRSIAERRVVATDTRPYGDVRAAESPGSLPSVQP